MKTPRSRPLLIYDGDCGFCRRRIARWKILTGDRVEYAPYQGVQDQFPGISQEQFEASVWLIEPGGRITRGAEAVFGTLSYSKAFSWIPWVYRWVPGVKGLTEWGYRIVARHRKSLSAGEECPLPQTQGPGSYFLKSLGLIYAVAFLSLWTQILGLIGKDGILPVEELLKAASQQLGPERFRLLPTLFWLNASDLSLQILCAAGFFLSLTLILGRASSLALFLLWAFYLSIAVVGREFLSFQWDALLLETGFLAIFLTRRSKTVLWLFRWLLFRLMFTSAAVKLLSGDPSWRDLTALTFHYETQPLPNAISWYAHQLPVWFQKVSCGTMFFIEGIVPFFFFGPRRLRIFACGVTIFFQGLILITGNYCFFNWLAIGLCLLLLENRGLPSTVPSKEGIEGQSAKGSPARHDRPIGAGGGRPGTSRWPRWVIGPVALVIGLTTAVQIAGLFRVPVRWPKPVVQVFEFLGPFRSINRYGLFAVMTTSRPEIILEGSNDGVAWVEYEFKYKPGDLTARPRFNVPHQPRLDWQMWFAALGSYQENPWLINFCVRLLEGSPQVLKLLKRNPFPETPPRYVRAVLYDYQFTDFPTRRSTGAWWRREKRGLYCPVLSLKVPGRPDPFRRRG